MKCQCTSAVRDQRNMFTVTIIVIKHSLSAFSTQCTVLNTNWLFFLIHLSQHVVLALRTSNRISWLSDSSLVLLLFS